ncbi:NAD-dependent histone deacetylase sir2 [Mycoemilia scoparia]|uniref:NAD-dependent histone deacetylase sir2 n=1 Tax=Mycoemilia scoparia TaxID=417184 RepID=A0A9W7ZXK3_9FUNG|nr:NAD-dependent histone deacetylase sir2 [Mycoemilia scoparia]
MSQNGSYGVMGLNKEEFQDTAPECNKDSTPNLGSLPKDVPASTSDSPRPRRKRENEELDDGENGGEDNSETSRATSFASVKKTKLSDSNSLGCHDNQGAMSKEDANAENEEQKQSQSLAENKDNGRDNTDSDGTESIDEELTTLVIDDSSVPTPLQLQQETIDINSIVFLGGEDKEKLRDEARSLGCDQFLKEYVFEKGYSVHTLLDVFDFFKPLFALSIPQAQMIPLLRYAIIRFCKKRPKLKNINSVKDAIQLIKSAKNIMILTGAGANFRSPTGIYTRLNNEFGLDDPQQMFDIEYFRETPELFYSFAKELYPSNFKPSPSHAFISVIEEKGKLLRNYTQNIDTLEHIQGIKRVLNCHGSFATATCITCGYHCDGKEIKEDIMAMKVAQCPKCLSKKGSEQGNKARNASSGSLTHLLLGGENSDDDDDVEYGQASGIMKPDITFFGEKLPDTFDRAFAEDKDRVDLLLVMGSSLKVAPVSDIMNHLPQNIPQIVINKTPILHLGFDIQLLGDADDIVSYISYQCGWNLRHPRIAGGSTTSVEFSTSMKKPAENPGPIKFGNGIEDGQELRTYDVPSHWHIFPGAIISESDLKVASGEDSLRLAVSTSDEEDYSSSDDGESDNNSD